MYVNPARPAFLSDELNGLGKLLAVRNGIVEKRDILVLGQSPWTAADAPVGLRFRFLEGRTWGSGADEGVRPTKMLLDATCVVDTHDEHLAAGLAPHSAG